MKESHINVAQILTRYARLCLRKAVQLSLGCALLTGIVSAGDAKKPLQLVLYTPLNVDGGTTTASTTLRIHNPNPGPMNYTLAILNAKAKNTNEEADWVVTFYGADNKPAGPILDGRVAANKSISVRVDLSHVVEAGETTAELTNNSAKIADLRLVKDQGLPFRVSLRPSDCHRNCTTSPQEHPIRDAMT